MEERRKRDHYTPMAIAMATVILTAVLGLIGYLTVDKLNVMRDATNSIDAKTDKLFNAVSDLKTGLYNYQTKSEARFATLATILKVRLDP